MGHIVKHSDIGTACGTEEYSTGPLKKLFHYAIFQKFFHIFILH